MTVDSQINPVNVDALRKEVKSKYREVAVNPSGEHHFHTGRYLASHLGYDEAFVQPLPDAAVESFAGVANPFALRQLAKGEKVIDVGCGAGFDSFVAAHQVGPTGSVVGIDMTEEMLAKSRLTVGKLGLTNVEFREGLAEHLPVDNKWADVVISNGAINLCADRKAVFAEIYRVLRPVVISSLRTSQTASRCPNRRSRTSISGRLESPVVCRAQPGNECWKRLGSLTFGLDRRWIPSEVPLANRKRGYSRSTDIPSWLANLFDQVAGGPLGWNAFTQN